MKTNYGKIAYQKTEDILNQLDYSDEQYKNYLVCYRNKEITYSTNMFEHSIYVKEGSVVKLNIAFEYSVLPVSNVPYKVYLNDAIILESSLQNVQISFVASGLDRLHFVFTGDILGVSTNDTKVMPKFSYIKCEYFGLFTKTFTQEPIYFDDNMTYYCTYVNGVYTRYTGISNLLNNYRYETCETEFFYSNSSTNSTRKQSIYGLYYNKETGMLTLKYMYTNADFPLKEVNPQQATFMSISSTLFRIVYLLDGKLYFFTCSKSGTDISEDTEITYISNLKIKSLFSVRFTQENTVNFYGIGLITTNGVYILRYDSTSKNFTSKKYIGKAEYASGYYDSNTVNIVLYNDGVATVKTYLDRDLTNLSSTKNYYNYLMIYNASGTLLGLNYNGFTNLTELTT